MRNLCISIISVALLVAASTGVVVGSDPGSRPAIPSAGCGVSMTEPGQHSGTMEVAGVERTWELAVPSVHDGQTPLPLVIGLHGGSEFYSSLRLLKLAEEEGFVAVAPRDAYQDWWMVWEPQSPGYDLSLDNPDVALVDTLIDRLSEELCLDLARVYATGFCVGAAGASVLGCVLDDRIAAIAPVIGTPDLGETCNLQRPVPILTVHGTRDMDASYEGGVADWFQNTVMKDGSRVRESAWGQWLLAATEVSIPANLAVTAERYGCAPEPAVEPLGEAEHYVWDCPEGVEVELVAHDGGHTWLSTTDGRTTEQLIWDFFEQHPLPAQEEAGAGSSEYLYGEVEGFLHHDMVNPLGCAVGFTSHATGSGESTLLGPTTVEQWNCYVPTDTFVNSANASISFSGEGSDSLAGTMPINCLPDWTEAAGDVFTCISEITVTGGTGAYEGASGTIHAVGFVTNADSKDPAAAPGDAPYEVVFEGLIEY